MNLQTKREIKSQEKRKQIILTAKKIIEEFGVSSLTVKNVCKLSEISNGTFFHYFSSKENLIAAYMHYSYSEYLKKNPLTFSQEDYILNLILLHEHNIQYTKLIGVEFVRVYYNINNENLANRGNMNGEEYTIQIMDFLERAASAGHIDSSLPLDEIGANICMVAKGVIFEWGICGNTFDVDLYIAKMLKVYIRSIVSKKYLDKFPLSLTD